MDVLEVARSLQPLVRAHADESERARRLAPPVLAALADAGLFRMAAPAVYGGLEVDPCSMVAALEAISEADGATGWTLMIGVETVGMATAGVAPGVAERILGGKPNVVFSGAINPLGRATPVEGGLMVTGQWPYASGCEGSDYFWGGCILVDRHGVPLRTEKGYRQARQVIVPREDYTVDRTWLAAGLCGSGSHDVVVSEVFVPDDYVTDIYTSLSVDTPLFRLPVFSRLAFNKVGVATGVARAAIDAFRALAVGKTPFREARPPVRAAPGPDGDGRGRGPAPLGPGLRVRRRRPDVGHHAWPVTTSASRSRPWCGWRARTAAPKRCGPSRSSTPRPASPPASPRRRWSAPSATSASCPST